MQKRGGRAPGLHFNLTGDDVVALYRVSHAQAVLGLDHPELDPLTAKYNGTVGRHVDVQQNSRDDRGQLPVDGIDAVNGSLGLDCWLAAIPFWHDLCSANECGPLFLVATQCPYQSAPVSRTGGESLALLQSQKR